MTPTEIVPGLADVPVAKSGVSFIDGKRARLAYRGIAVETLAKESSYEETCWLLLKGALPTQRELAGFHQELRSKRAVHYRLLDMIECFPASGHPMDALQAATAAMGMFYPHRDVTDKKGNWDASVRLIAAFPTLVAAFGRIKQGLRPIDPHPDLDHAANFFYMLFGKEPSPSVRKVLDAALVVHAEHTMNASTFTCRVAGSTLSTPYHAVAAAVGALAGPLHGGANEEVVMMLDEIGPASNARKWLDDNRKANPSFKVMGMGHRVYKVKDPRAVVVQDLAERVFAESVRPAQYETALELEKACAEIYGVKGVWPNVDFFSGVVYRALGIPIEQFTPIFAMSRVVGWLAHWNEQMEANRIFRPEQVYTGPEDVAYLPLEKRA